VSSSHYILIAEDDPIIRALIARVVTTTVPDSQLVIAATGTEALNALQQQRFTAIITDYNMPGATGLDVVALARSQSPTVPIVLLSADSNIQTAALAAGAHYFVHKPFAVEDLTQLVRRIFNLSE
jgi:CheY-like chemotaxis protein